MLTGKKAEKARMLISRTGRCSSGLTFLELIVALFIISLVTAIVLPSFFGFGEKKMESEVREMASILRHLNDSAIARKETFVVRFDLNENMVVWEGPEGKRSRKFEDMTGVTTQSSGFVSKGEIIFLFEPLGARENLSVHMSREDKEITVTLNHLSGRVKII